MPNSPFPLGRLRHQQRFLCDLSGWRLLSPHPWPSQTPLTQLCIFHGLVLMQGAASHWKEVSLTSAGKSWELEGKSMGSWDYEAWRKPDQWCPVHKGGKLTNKTNKMYENLREYPWIVGKARLYPLQQIMTCNEQHLHYSAYFNGWVLCWWGMNAYKYHIGTTSPSEQPPKEMPQLREQIFSSPWGMKQTISTNSIYF